MISIWGERIAAVVCAVFAVYMMYIAWNFPANGELFPLFCGFAAIFVAILMIVRSIVSPGVFAIVRPKLEVWQDLKPLLLTAGVIAYVLIFFYVGYYVSSALFLTVMAVLAGVRSWRTILITVLVTFPLMYAFFELFLNAQMPRGFLI